MMQFSTTAPNLCCSNWLSLTNPLTANTGVLELPLNSTYTAGTFLDTITEEDSEFELSEEDNTSLDILPNDSFEHLPFRSMIGDLDYSGDYEEVIHNIKPTHRHGNDYRLSICDDVGKASTELDPTISEISFDEQESPGRQSSSGKGSLDLSIGAIKSSDPGNKIDNYYNTVCGNRDDDVLILSAGDQTNELYWTLEKSTDISHPSPDNYWMMSSENTPKISPFLDSVHDTAEDTRVNVSTSMIAKPVCWKDIIYSPKYKKFDKDRKFSAINQPENFYSNSFIYSTEPSSCLSSTNPVTDQLDRRSVHSHPPNFYSNQLTSANKYDLEPLSNYAALRNSRNGHILQDRSPDRSEYNKESGPTHNSQPSTEVTVRSENRFNYRSIYAEYEPVESVNNSNMEGNTQLDSNSLPSDRGSLSYDLNPTTSNNLFHDVDDPQLYQQSTSSVDGTASSSPTWVANSTPRSYLSTHSKQMDHRNGPLQIPNDSTSSGLRPLHRSPAVLGVNELLSKTDEELCDFMQKNTPSPEKQPARPDYSPIRRRFDHQHLHYHKNSRQSDYTDSPLNRSIHSDLIDRRSFYDYGGDEDDEDNGFDTSLSLDRNVNINHAFLTDFPAPPGATVHSYMPYNDSHARILLELFNLSPNVVSWKDECTSHMDHVLIGKNGLDISDLPFIDFDAQGGDNNEYVFNPLRATLDDITLASKQSSCRESWASHMDGKGYSPKLFNSNRSPVYSPLQENNRKRIRIKSTTEEEECTGKVKQDRKLSIPWLQRLCSCFRTKRERLV